MANTENYFEISNVTNKEDLPENAWKVRPCESYKDEYKDCKSLRARFHQYFVHGETVDCSQWKKDYENCQLFRHKRNVKSLEDVIQSENERYQKRKNFAIENNVWEYRIKPPENWNSEMPEWMVERKKNSLLIETQNLLNEGHLF